MDSNTLILSKAVEAILKALYDDFQLLELDTQGACSYTALSVTVEAGVQTRKIIQAREARYALNLDITDEATRVYGHLAPATKLLATMPLPLASGQQTFFFYELDLIPGVPYSELVPRKRTTDEDTIIQQRMLVGHLARFFARGWYHKSDRPDCTGSVGSKIPDKLEQLAARLPSEDLCTVARWALSEATLLKTLPVVLTHGDIVPSNIMVHPDTGMLQGMVDWVEAEFLPFGLAFYGLEYLLGYPSMRRDSMTGSTASFVYYDCAPALRSHFWMTLAGKIPELQTNPDLLRAIRVAKVIGTLMWFGFAWDDGAIDRVVSASRDVDTLMHLKAFLSAEIEEWSELSREKIANFPSKAGSADNALLRNTVPAIVPNA